MVLSSTEGLSYGVHLVIDTGSAQETVTVVGVTADSFSAVFTNPHPVGTPIEIDSTIKMYPRTNEFPAAIQGYVGNNVVLPLTDPWGNFYHYISPGENADYELVSFGADGIVEKNQTDPQKLADPLTADIVSWAEASLIGQWYEYTPTSALDIAFAEILPNA